MQVLDRAGTGVSMSPSKAKRHHTSLDRLFRYAELLNYGDVHIKFDPATGLRAIVAINNLKRGPAIGGCRVIHYRSADDALEDALRLAYMMSYKAAINNLNHGGAKAVLMMPKVIKNREAYFEAFGNFVDELGGRYITAMDSGTSTSDMDIIARRTPYVTCTTGSGSGGDPSPHTAFGVYRALESAVKFKLGRDDLEGLHVAIQGVGHVGYFLAKALHEAGAKLTVCDVNEKSLQRCVEEFGAAVVAPDSIYDIEADVFSPCALGAILNLTNIKRLKVSAVVGSANNQLAHHHYGAALHERGILYAPDFLVNAGGLIQVAVIYDHADEKKAHEQIGNIYHTAMTIFETSKAENRATSEIAESMAVKLLR
ncbi:MAG: Glu/Leu/Phe/Val dehydrogenase dimerization domain-containing protein [Gammaproteobacteria bacterium]|nr:Glu/Leu/Phe/Val dehydrogenase dimerization domain-containing protein [Gammaproteobacteria bacterium]